VHLINAQKDKILYYVLGEMHKVKFILLSGGKGIFAS